MKGRFQIEEWIEQDTSGVVFRARDSELDRLVAVRRFFPFGAEGGGLEGEERVAYEAAVARLVDLSHRALRSVVAGGCDPVDGLPFLATEWIDGETLATKIERDGPLAPPVVAEMLERALDVSARVSAVLGDEGVWVETCPKTIVFDEGGRGFTFWICPLRWLGGAGEDRSLASLANLAEEALGWRGRLVSAQSGDGLGGWIKRARTRGSIGSLTEARAALEKPAVPVAVDPPPAPVRNAPVPTVPPAPVRSPAVAAAPIRPSVRPRGPKPKRPKKPVRPSMPSSGPWVFSLVGAVAVGALGTLLVVDRRPNSRAPAAAAAPPLAEAPAVAAHPEPEPPVPAAVVPEPEVAAEPRAPQDASALVGSSKIRRPSSKPDPRQTVEALAARQLEERAAEDLREQELRAEREAARAERGGIFLPGDREMLVELAAERGREEIAIEGVVGKIHASSSGATLYVAFDGHFDAADPRGAIKREFAEGGLSRRELETLVGKRVRIVGPLRREFAGRGRFRPVVDIERSEAITESP